MIDGENGILSINYMARQLMGILLFHELIYLHKSIASSLSNFSLYIKRDIENVKISDMREQSLVYFSSFLYSVISSNSNKSLPH